MPSISARAKWWCQCDFLFEDPKFRVYVQKWRMRVYNEGYYWYISFKYQKPCSFPLLPCTSISGLVPSIISLFLEVYSEIHLPPGFALHSFVQPKSEKKSNTHQKTHIWLHFFLLPQLQNLNKNMHFAGFGGWFLTYQPVNPETPPPKQPFLISNCGPEIKGIKSAPLHRKWLLRAAIVLCWYVPEKLTLKTGQAGWW